MVFAAVFWSGARVGCKPCRVANRLLAAMAPKKRELRNTPSCPEDLRPVCKLLSQRLDEEYQHIMEARYTFHGIVHTYTQEHAKPMEMQTRVAKICDVVGLAYDTACWESIPNIGHTKTAIMQWAFCDESMWRGPPKNKIVLKYAKSMAAVGFRQGRP